MSVGSQGTRAVASYAGPVNQSGRQMRDLYLYQGHHGIFETQGNAAELVFSLRVHWLVMMRISPIEHLSICLSKCTHCNMQAHYSEGCCSLLAKVHPVSINSTPPVAILITHGIFLHFLPVLGNCSALQEPGQGKTVHTYKLLAQCNSSYHSSELQ